MFIRLPLKFGLSKLGSLLNSRLPTYTIDTDGITIDLKIIFLNEQERKSIVKILLNEIDEIKELNYIEAQSLLNFQLGPDLTLQTASAKDLTSYLKKEIPRPNYYIFGPNSGTKTLLIRGPKLFYLISVANKDNRTLISNKFQPKTKFDVII